MGFSCINSLTTHCSISYSSIAVVQSYVKLWEYQ